MDPIMSLFLESMKASYQTIEATESPMEKFPIEKSIVDSQLITRGVPMAYQNVTSQLTSTHRSTPFCTCIYKIILFTLFQHNGVNDEK